MKIKMKKNSFAVIAFVVGMSFFGVAHADTVSVYITPSSITKSPGAVFDATVRVSNSAVKVYAVEGTLVFNNMTCKNITITSGLMAQSVPTCANPYFLIGSTTGMSTDSPLMTVSVKAGASGSGSILVSDPDIIGDGISLSKVSTPATYTISALKIVPKQVISTTEKTAVAATNTASFIDIATTTVSEVATATVAETATETPTNNLSANAGSSGVSFNEYELVAVLLAGFFGGMIFSKIIGSKKTK